MKQPTKITFINSADYDYFELAIDGDVAVYGTNDSGKTTCARAVMFGEHAALSAMNFGNNEKMDYYFHKGQNEGLLIYDYVDIRPDGIAMPYCLIISSQHIHFVTTAYVKEWMYVNGKLTTDWSKIRANIEAISGDVQVYAVSSLRSLETILQGTYIGSDAMMQRMTRQFSIFRGRDGRPGAVPKIIESLWKNGAMQQQDMKRIIIDRAEIEKKERLEREPPFDVSAARTLSDGFDEGWNDFSKNKSGELPALMNQISNTYKNYKDGSTQLLRFPSIIHSVKETKQRQLEESRTLAAEQETLMGEADEKKRELQAHNKAAFQVRSEQIGKVSGEIAEIKAGYNRYSAEKWEKINQDILDLEILGTLNRNSETLRAEIEAIEKNDEDHTRALVDAIAQRTADHDTLESTTNTRIAELMKQQVDDENIRTLNEKKANVNAEVAGQQAFKDERDALAKTLDSLKQEQTDIKRAEESLTKISNTTNLVDRFRNSNDLSFLGTISQQLVEKIFRLVYVFICKELYGLEDLSKNGIEKKRASFTEKRAKYNARFKTYEADKEQETKRLSSLYEEQIAAIVREYKHKEDELRNNLLRSKNLLDSFVKEKNKEIDAIRASNGIDVAALNKKKEEYKAQKERCEYLASHASAISQLKGIRDSYAALDERENNLKALRQEHQAKTKEEDLAEAEANKGLDSIKKTLDDAKAAIRKIDRDLKTYAENLPALASDLSMDNDTLTALIDNAPFTEVDPNNEKRLTDYVVEWKEYSATQNKYVIALRTQCQALQGMLSKKDFFEFSIKPEDSLTTDADILRVADIVTRRNNATSVESIVTFLNNWRRTWNQYLRLIYKIGERATNHSNIIDTVRRLQTFINKNNEAPAITDIAFEIENGTDNPLVEKAIELKEILDQNRIDVDYADITEGVDNNLFKLETISESLQRKLIRIMSDFTKSLAEYKPNTIPPEDFFTLYTCVKEIGKNRVRVLNVNDIGSTGTQMTLKAMLAVCFVGEAMKADRTGHSERNMIHIFVDEFGRADPWNKKAVKKVCQTFNVQLFSTEPYAENTVGDEKYGYSLHYDKLRHQRTGKPILRERLKPSGEATAPGTEPTNKDE